MGPWLAPLLLVAAGALSASAQDRVVQGVEFAGNRRLTASHLRTQVKTREGRRFSRSDAYEDVNRLYGLGDFSYVDVNLDEGYEGGVRVRFTVVERLKVEAIYLEGRRHVRRTDVLELLQTAEGKLLSDYLLKADAEAIETLYREKGYLFARVEPRISEGTEGAEVTFAISEGPLVRVERLHIRGNREVTDKTLAKLAETRATGWLGWLNPTTYDPEVFDDDLERLRAYYRSQGYVDVEVRCDGFRLSEDKTRLHLTVGIREGPRYTVESIEIHGNTVFPTPILMDEVKLKPGDPFLGDKLQESLDAIERLYGRRAYIFARPVVSAIYAEGGPRVALRIDMEEGERIYVEKIRFRGNTKTRDKVIRRELVFYPGQAYDSEKVDESLARVAKLRVFKPGSVRLDFEEGSAPNTRDVVMEVEEDRTGAFLFGGGVASNVGAFGNIALTQRNFDLFDVPRSWDDFLGGHSWVGAGQQLSLRLQPGFDRSVYQLHFSEPYLLDRPVSLATDFYFFDRFRRDYTEQRLGGSVGLGRRFQRDLSVDLTYRLEDVSIFDVEVDAPSDVVAVEGRTTLSSLTLGAAYNRQRLDPRAVLPYQGYEVSASCELGGNFLGGEVDFSKWVLGAEQAWTLYRREDERRTILMARARAGWMEPNGRTDAIPIYERFYMGGPGTVRGFEYRGIGPRELGEPIGGTVTTYGGAELSQPLYEDVFRAIAFLDAGNLAADVEDYEADALRSAYGAGLRIYVPIFPQPIALDFGFPIQEEPEDERRTFHFSIGFGF
ncbi:MAG: outer membrane protein assembly factor BamA [Planctomycetes bacterium]|nr:outer membrane protein assembly factor BamA [Planctomycetota bacterium]